MPIREVVTLRNGPQVPASQTALKVADVRMPRAGRVQTAHIFCRALAGTVSVDIHKNDVSILSAVVTPTAGDQVAGTVSTSLGAFGLGDRLSAKVTTAGASTLDDLSVTLNLG